MYNIIIHTTEDFSIINVADTKKSERFIMSPEKGSFINDFLNETLGNEQTNTLLKKVIEKNFFSIHSKRYKACASKIALADQVGYVFWIEENSNEEQLAKNYLKNIVYYSPGFMYLKDKNSYYLMCNENFAKAAGLNHPDEIIGKSDYDLAWGKTESDLFRRGDAEVLAGNAKVNFEEPQLQADGKTRIVLANKIPLYDEDNNIIGILGNYVDITDRKQMEQELQQAKQLAESANKAKSAFVANISHDVRNSLAGVNGISEIMMSMPEQRTEENARMINESGNILLNMMNKILDFVRAENPDFRVLHKDEQFSISAMVNDLIALYTPSAFSKKLALTLDISKDTPVFLMSKPHFIHKILVNLLGNALKFTDEGSVTVEVSISDINNETKDATLYLAVKDTGTGIPDDKKQAVFEWFERLTPAYQGIHEGTGMGLATVKQSIEALAGKIEILDNEPNGAIFACEIPVKVVDEITAEEHDNSYMSADAVADAKRLHNKANGKTETSYQSKVQGKKILLIEDVPMAAKGAIGLLEKIGMAVDWVDTGEKGLAAILTGVYDIIISDIGLPGMSGDEVARQARSAGAHLPIYALTGHSDRRETLLNAGFTDVLVKPLNLEQFSEMLSAHENIPPADTHKVIDLETGIAAEYDRMTIQEFLMMFIDTLPAEINQLKRAIAQKDMEKILNELHTMKGSACYAPVPEFNEVLKTVYQQLKQPDRENKLDEIFNPVFDAYDRLMVEAKKYL